MIRANLSLTPHLTIFLSPELKHNHDPSDHFVETTAHLMGHFVKAQKGQF
jgi:hypothetical protein